MVSKYIVWGYPLFISATSISYLNYTKAATTKNFFFNEQNRYLFWCFSSTG